MEITEVKVFPIQEEKLKAFVSVVFDHCFMVNDIKIIQGRDGLFISMPSRKKKNGEFKDVAHPLNNETRRMIEDKVLVEYERALDGRGEAMPAALHAAAPAAGAPSGPTAVPRLAAAPAPAAAMNPQVSAAVPTRAAAPAPVAAVAPVASLAPLAPHPPIAPLAPVTPAAPFGGMAGIAAAVTAPSSGDGSTLAGPAVAAGPAAAAGGAPDAAATVTKAEKTLEEIEEMHLRDSFWTVT